MEKKSDFYQPPPAPFKPNQLIWWRGHQCRVIASTHTHTQLEGFPWAVWNFELQSSQSAENTKPSKV